MSFLLEFSSHNQVTTKPVSDSSPFRGPKPPELSQFRRSIEAGDCDTVEKAIWRNPRFLVSSGDTPTVLQVVIS